MNEEENEAQGVELPTMDEIDDAIEKAFERINQKLDEVLK